MRIDEIEPSEFREYIKEYIERIEKAFDRKIKCVDVSMAKEIGDNIYLNHYIYHFRLDGTEPIDLTPKQIEVLNEDDDSQPHNAFRIYLDDVWVYSTRGE